MHFHVVRLLLPLLRRQKGPLMEQAGWEMQQACEERERAAIEALQRCMKAGADPEAIKTLARECGIDIRYVTLDAQRSAA